MRFAIRLAVDPRLKVPADARITRLFDGIEMPAQITKQETVGTTAFGGPNKCTGRAMRLTEGDAVLAGLNDTDFDAVVESLGGAFSVPRRGCVFPWS